MRALPLLLLLACAGCHSNHPWRPPPGWGKLALCGPGPTQPPGRDMPKLLRRLNDARRLRRAGQAINALAALSDSIGDADLRPDQQLRLLRDIQQELERRQQGLIPLERELIELVRPAAVTAPPREPRPPICQVQN